jgi:hypothetical protein
MCAISWSRPMIVAVSPCAGDRGPLMAGHRPSRRRWRRGRPWSPAAGDVGAQWAFLRSAATKVGAEGRPALRRRPSRVRPRSSYRGAEWAEHRALPTVIHFAPRNHCSHRICEPDARIGTIATSCGCPSPPRQAQGTHVNHAEHVRFARQLGPLAIPTEYDPFYPTSYDGERPPPGYSDEEVVAWREFPQITRVDNRRGQEFDARKLAKDPTALAT